MDDDESPPQETCPVCGAMMNLAGVVPKLARHPELRSFRCTSCNEVVTKPVTGEK